MEEAHINYARMHEVTVEPREGESEACYELRRFIHVFAEGYNSITEAMDIAPQDDGPPMLGVVPTDGIVAMVPIPGFALGNGRVKDRLFGEGVPQVIAQIDGEQAAFVSYSWHTPLSAEESQAIADKMKAEGLDPHDSAKVREIAESLGIEISGEDRRVEMATLCACSKGAEAMMSAHVERDGENAPRVRWVFDEPDKDSRDMVGLTVRDRDRTTRERFEGRVPEGLRLGIDRALPGMGDWRTTG